MYEYYSKQLPQKINQFLQGDIQGFDERKCLSFKKEITTMQGFDEKFKNTTRFVQIKKELVSKLDDLNNRYAQEQINSNTNQ